MAKGSHEVVAPLEQYPHDAAEEPLPVLGWDVMERIHIEDEIEIVILERQSDDTADTKVRGDASFPGLPSRMRHGCVLTSS